MQRIWFKIVTAASRYNVGELFWLGYNPTFNKKNNAQARIQFGSQLVAVSQQGAGIILEYMHSGHSTPDHIDRWLVKYCENFALSAGRCGYVFPPVGCFGQHVSECCPSEGTRVTWWEEAYIAEGTGQSTIKRVPGQMKFTASPRTARAMQT